MITTVVGSFPVNISHPNNIKDKILNTFGKFDPYNNMIEDLIEFQFNLGIDIVSEGQTRDDMVALFVKNIPGFRYENNTSFIKGKIQAPNNGITINDVKLAQSKLNNLIKESDLTKDEAKNKGVKGIITGPSTIIHSSRLESFYKDKNNAIIDYANAIKKEVNALDKLKLKYIQIDEPFLSTGMVDLKTAKQAIDIITKGVKTPVAIHVCGDISNVFKDLTQFNVDILDLEFAGNNTNIKVLEENKLLIKDKKIGFGCINSASKNLDSKEKVLNLIEKGMDIVGSENLILDPDCGLSKLPFDMVNEKLTLMCDLNKQLSLGEY